MDTDQTSGVIPGTEGLSGAQAPAADTSAPVQSTPMPAGATQVAAPAQAPQQAPASSGPQMAAPGTPHAGLRNMIQSLFLGMDAFAASAATQGKEGGVEEVQRFKAQQQNMALKAKADQREQSQADAMIQHTQALTNATIAQTEINKMNAPLEHQKLVIGNQDALYDLYVNKLHINPLFAVPIVQGQTTDDHMAAINGKANGDLVNHTVIPVHDGAVGGPGNSYGFSFDQLRKVNVPIEQAAPVLANLQNQINFAKGVLPNGEKDPAIQAAQGRLDVLKKGATINGFDFFNFDNQVQAQVLSRVNNQQAISDYNKKQNEAKEAAQKADPLFKMENEPGEMSGEKSAAAIPLLQNKLSDPNTAPADKVRATRLLAQANSAHALFQQDQIQKANAEQQAKQGDPNQAGALLANGSLTLGDMKTRGMTPKFIMDATKAAQAIDKTYNPADEIAAESIAKSPAMNQFFTNTNSLISKGGTIDQLISSGSNLPNNKFPLFNKLADAENYAAGHPEYAAYKATALGVTDDYAKVVGGGTPSEHMQLMILNSVTGALNQDTRIAVANAMKKAVVSQAESKIGTNQFLMRRYGYALPGNQPAAAKFDPKTDFKPITPTQ